MTILTPTYKQIDKLKRLRPEIRGEWILAIDGCKQTKEWAEENGIKYVYHERNGRQYNKIVNMAAKEATEKELLLISGDSIPDKGYYEAIYEPYKPDRIVCGLRVNVDESMKIASCDHRLVWYPNLPREPFKIEGDEPWVVQTSNGMLVAKEVWDKLGGMDETYKGYGIVDQDFCMRAHYMGIENWWAPKAVLNHMHIENLKDNPYNYKKYEERKANYSA